LNFIIIVFLVVRGCNNYLTNQIRNDVNKDKIEKVEKEQIKNEKIDFNKPFTYYNITNDYELREQVSEMITMIANALSYRRMINRVTVVDEE